jgi:hypothetical protein
MIQWLKLISRTLLLVVLAVGVFLNSCTPKAENVSGIVHLNTAEMIEADDSIIDSTMGPGLVSAYLCEIKSNSNNDSIPYADVYVCKSFKRDSILGDTVIILDTQLRKEISGDPNIYWTGLQKAKNQRVCKIAISPDQLSKIKKYPYKYARLTLITDD